VFETGAGKREVAARELTVRARGRGEFALVGAFGIGTVDRFEDRFEEMVGSDGNVVLDMAAVSFIDSTGVAAIVRLARSLGDRSLRVIGASGTVRATLLISGVGHLPGITLVTE
jgi:anti-anti-sigma factor